MHSQPTSPLEQLPASSNPDKQDTPDISNDFSGLHARLQAVNERIEKACRQSGRERTEVTLELAVKTRSAETIIAAGQELQRLGLPLVFGHNHVQEAVATNPAVRAAFPAAEIHLIGHLQSNKINPALREFDLIESIDSLNLLEKLHQRLLRSASATPGLARLPLPVYLEVNCSGQSQKHGVAPAEAGYLAQEILQRDEFELKGFMTVATNANPEQAKADFSCLRQIRDQVCALDMPGAAQAQALSMGMSGDLEIAIAAGSSLVRIGTDVFGARDYSPKTR